MRNKNFKGRCKKRVISKRSKVCRTYDVIQYAYADVLQASVDVKEIRCNVPLDRLDIGEYTSDFICIKSDNGLMVRECVFRKILMKPFTVKLLDASKEYWLRIGEWSLMKKYDLFRNDDTIIRILEIASDRVLIIDCIKRIMPTWVEILVLDSFADCTDEELNEVTGIPSLILILLTLTREKLCMTDIH